MPTKPRKTCKFGTIDISPTPKPQATVYVTIENAKEARKMADWFLQFADWAEGQAESSSAGGKGKRKVAKSRKRTPPGDYRQ